MILEPLHWPGCWSAVA